MAINEDIPLAKRLEAELEYLGYISYTDPKMKNIGLVLDVNAKYSPKITIYRLDTGETATHKLSKALYQKKPFDKGSIINFYAEMRPKSKLVDGEWVKTNEQESWISNYLIKSDL